MQNEQRNDYEKTRDRFTNEKNIFILILQKEDFMKMGEV